MDSFQTMRVPIFVFALLFTCTPISAQQFDPAVLHPDLVTETKPELYPFFHGVASGDPLPNAVIIWTRVSPKSDKQESGSLCSDATETDEIPVRYEVALDADFQQIIETTNANTNPDKDYTLKIDVQNLEPATVYYYRFFALGNYSQIGRTRTAQIDDAPVRLAVLSCNNFQDGYFNGFRQLAQADTLDAVLHLGDYIYEYGTDQYRNKKVDRLHVPAHELKTLADYRTRFSQYRLDPDLSAAHMQHAFICIWDDHEIANDAYTDGAKNHNTRREGLFETRKTSAKQAYYEWLPVRDGDHIYRSFVFGSMAETIMLDERMEGRHAPAINKADLRADTTRSMLGATQLKWWKERMRHSKARWKIIGNQVLFAQLNIAPLVPRAFVNFDAWDGYPHERAQVLKFLKTEQITNTIFATGDTHCTWSFRISEDMSSMHKPKASKILAYELATPSISSSNMDEYTNKRTARFFEKSVQFPRVNPHLNHMETRNHGFFTLTLTQTQADAQWYYVDTVIHPSNGIRKGPFTRIMATPETIQTPALETPAQEEVPEIMARALRLK